MNSKKMKKAHKSGKKRHKEKKLSPAPTANAKIIRDLMGVNKIRGNFKDYTIIAGRRMIDWLGSYDLYDQELTGTVGINGMKLFHKRQLRKVLGDKIARRFWLPGIGRTNFGVESRRNNVVKN